jgi:hypothetical protein
MNAIVRTWPRLAFTSGTLEALKWFAVACMILDHGNRVLTGYTLGPAAELFGRLAFPIFAFVFGYNLARRGVDHRRIASRLFWWGVLASVVYVPLFGWWPLNVLFTLFAAALIVHVWEDGGYWRISQHRIWPLVFVAGLFVDYLWPGVVLVVATYAYVRRPGLTPALFAAGSLFGIAALVGNLYAFAALPLLAVVTRIDIDLPRSRSAFLWVYVLHLGVLALLARV